MNRATSESPARARMRRCIRSVSGSRGRCTPGRSTSTSCQPSPVATPRIARRVVCGLSETIATFPPTIRFDQRRLAGVRPPGEGHEAAAPRHAAPARRRSGPGARASRRRRSRGRSRRGGARRAPRPRPGPSVCSRQITTSPSSRGPACAARAVDREREHVGGRIAPAVLAVEPPDLVLADERDRQVPVAPRRRRRAQRARPRAARLGAATRARCSPALAASASAWRRGASGACFSAYSL